jgi:hypothetical protein
MGHVQGRGLGRGASGRVSPVPIVVLPPGTAAMARIISMPQASPWMPSLQCARKPPSRPPCPGRRRAARQCSISSTAPWPRPPRRAGPRPRRRGSGRTARARMARRASCTTPTSWSARLKCTGVKSILISADRRSAQGRCRRRCGRVPQC